MTIDWLIDKKELQSNKIFCHKKKSQKLNYSLKKMKFWKMNKILLEKNIIGNNQKSQIVKKDRFYLGKDKEE